MDFNALYKKIYTSKNQKNSEKMAAYMRNKFPFLGVPTPKRKELCTNYFKLAKKEKLIDWEFVDSCFENDYREMQYIAVDYLKNMQKFLTEKDISKIKKLIMTKSWWDTVDLINGIVGHIALENPQVNDILLLWSVNENIWLRRIAIDHQLSRKEKTDTELLEKILVNNLHQKEFFINKAIGWSLRDYSKTNPDWVRGFITKYKDKMAQLSIKEASKYI